MMQLDQTIYVFHHASNVSNVKVDRRRCRALASNLDREPEMAELAGVAKRLKSKGGMCRGFYSSASSWRSAK